MIILLATVFMISLCWYIPKRVLFGRKHRRH